MNQKKIKKEICCSSDRVLVDQRFAQRIPEAGALVHPVRTRIARPTTLLGLRRPAQSPSRHIAKVAVDADRPLEAINGTSEKRRIAKVAVDVVRPLEAINGTSEKRHIAKVAVNPSVLKNIFNSVCTCTASSFNLMIITTDTKVLLLERTQSFHFPKVVRDLKLNRISIDVLTSLYTSELEKIRQLFFDFLPPLINYGVAEKIVYVFPGGHSIRNEPVSKTLIRELQEETSIDINIQDLRFNKSCMFNVLIYDCIIKMYFNNFIFPVKVNMSSEDIYFQFKETKHTRNPTFVDISQCKTLFDAFLQVQRFMIL